MTCRRCGADRSPSARACVRCGLRFGSRRSTSTRRRGRGRLISPARHRRLEALARRWLPAIAVAAIVSAAVELGMLTLGLRGYPSLTAGFLAAWSTVIVATRPRTRRSWAVAPVAALAGSSVASVATAYLATGLAEVHQGELLIGGATLALAVATLWLGALTRSSELQRRREAQILDAHPLAVVVESHSPPGIPHRTVTIRATNSSPRPSLDVTGTIHYQDRLGRDGGAMSPAGYGVIDQGGTALFEFGLGQAGQSTYVIDVESRGMMGQRVTQTYRWLLAGIDAGERAEHESLILTRIAIKPTVGESVVIDHEW